MLVPCWFTVFVSGLDIQPQNVKPVFGCFCFVLRWWTSGKITSERLFIAKCCHQEWAAHACSRFAHGLLTVCSRFAHGFAHALLTLAEVPFESFRFLLSPYEVPFGSLRGSAHGLLTVCSRFAHGLLALLTVCSRFAHALGDYVSILMKKPISKPCHFFVVPSHVYLRHTAFRLQTPWGWLSNLKKNKHPHATHNPSLKRGCTPLPQPEICMCNVPFEPKGLRKYILYYGIMTCSFVAQRAQKVHL